MISYTHKKKTIFLYFILVVIICSVLLNLGGYSLIVCVAEETANHAKIVKSLNPISSTNYFIKANKDNGLNYYYSLNNYKQLNEIGNQDEVKIYNDNIYKFNNFEFDNGLLDETTGFSTTLYQNKNIADILYDNTKVDYSLLGNNIVEYKYEENSVKKTFNNIHYLDIYNAQGKLISQKKNDELKFTYQYNSEKLDKVIDNTKNRAFKIEYDANKIISMEEHLVFNGNTFMLSKNVYEEMPDYINNNIIINYDYIYNNERYMADKTNLADHREYKYINNILIAEKVKINNKDFQLEYIFDSYFNRLGFICDNNIYYYVYDSMGNVTEIVDENCNSLVTYYYDLLGYTTFIGDALIAQLNSYTFRAKDDWYFDLSTQQYYIGTDLIFNAQYAKSIGSCGYLINEFVQDPINKTIWNNSIVEVTPTIYQITNDKIVIENFVADQIGNAMDDNDIGISKEVLSINIDENICFGKRLDVLSISNKEEEYDNGLIYGIFNSDDLNNKEKIEEFLKYRDINSAVYTEDDMLIYPVLSEYSVKGHFIYNNQYVQYYSVEYNPAVVEYRILDKNNIVQDKSYGNLYDYDNERFVLFWGQSEANVEMATAHSLSKEIDYDAVSFQIESQLIGLPNGEYHVEEVEYYYISEEYIDFLCRNEKENLYLGGMNADDMYAQFGDDWSFTYYNGELVHSSELPPDAFDNERFNWGKFLKKISIGVGCILVASLVTVLTAGVGGAAAVGCFFATAATLTGVSIAGGVVGGTIKGVQTGTWEGFADGFADGFEFTAITASVAQTVGAIAGAPPISACFVAGTPILTNVGHINIEQINVGDYVKSYNEKTKQVEYNKVLNTFINQTNTLVKLTINGEKIVTTEEHPFYVVNIGWIKAGDLLIGNRVLLADKNIAIVQKIEIKQLAYPIVVYNFEVENNHNYFVGNSNVLVHNTCAGKTTTNVLGDIWKTKVGNLSKKVIIGGKVGRKIKTGEVIFKAGRILSIAKAADKITEEIIKIIKEIVEKKELNDVIYYRWGNYTVNNFTPEYEKDLLNSQGTNKGLSFQNYPPPSPKSKYCITTFKVLKKLTILEAIKDSTHHVTVKPIGDGPEIGYAKLEKWIKSRETWVYNEKGEIIQSFPSDYTIDIMSKCIGAFKGEIFNRNDFFALL